MFFEKDKTAKKTPKMVCEFSKMLEFIWTCTSWRGKVWLFNTQSQSQTLPRGSVSIATYIPVSIELHFRPPIVYPILILYESIFEKEQNGTLGFSMPRIVPEILRFLKYANEKRMTSFTQRLNKIHKMRNISGNNR